MSAKEDYDRQLNEHIANGSWERPPSDREDPPKPDAAMQAASAAITKWTESDDREPLEPFIAEALRAYARAEIEKLAEEYREKAVATKNTGLGIYSGKRRQAADVWREAADLADRAAGKEGA